MKLLILLILLFVVGSVFSQGLNNNGANLVIQNNCNLIIDGIGNLTNNGTINCNVNSCVKFHGTGKQVIAGGNPVQFYNLFIDNTGQGIELDLDISIQNNFRLNDGDFDLKDHDVDLGATGTLQNEAVTQRLKATNAIGTDGLGTGTIRATRNNPSGNIAGLGLEITPSAALGNTVVVRGHERQAGSGTFSGNWSVLRYYDIQPTNQNVIDLDFSYFSPVELNGHTDGNLIMFQEVQNTWNGVPGPVYWQPLTTVNTSPLASSSSVLNVLSNLKVTLGSQLTPLPVELINFDVQCQDNTKLISWETVSEYNNDYFSVQKSYDGFVFFEIDQIIGAGNSNQLLSYFVTDNEMNDAYYQLKQVDLNGQSASSPMRFSSCQELDGSQFYYFQNEEHLTLVFKSLPESAYALEIHNMQGKLIQKRIVQLDEEIFKYEMSKSLLSCGIYYITLHSGLNKITEKLILL